MALTEERLRTHQEGRSKVPSEIRSGHEQTRVSPRTPHTLAIAWFVAFWITTALQPAPADGASPPAWATAIALVFLGAVATALVGLALRMRWGALASLGASVIFTADVIACPVTGHHAFGTWWAFQLAAAVALLALSGAAALRPSA